MKTPEYIAAKWEKERKEKLQHAERMAASYKGIDEEASAWWMKKAEMLRNTKY